MYLPPSDAVAVWRERGTLRPTVNWREMMHEQHASAFTVAKIARLDLLSAVRRSLDDVIAGGGTFEQWKANILPELQKAGWWGVVQDRDLTGTDDAIVVNDARLRTIYRTNIRMSIAAGRWRRIQRQKDIFPYLRYKSDHYRKQPRLDHQSWHGIILPVDDPTWQWMFPPNGWGCNCLVEQISEDRMRRDGLSVSEPPEPAVAPFETPSGPIMVPRGVDPGFGYNPGTAHLDVLAVRAVESVERALEAGLDSAAELALREIIENVAFDSFLKLPNARFPVAVLTADQQATMAATSRLVLLSEGTYAKQLFRHPELTITDYRRLPDFVSGARVILQQGEQKLIFFADRRAPDRLWKVIVRQDEAESHPLVVSFHRTDLPEARREARQPGTSVMLDPDGLLR